MSDYALEAQKDVNLYHMTVDRFRAHGYSMKSISAELDVAGDVAFATLGFLELVPFPDRFVVREGSEVDGELAHKIGARDLIYIFTGHR